MRKSILHAGLLSLICMSLLPGCRNAEAPVRENNEPVQEEADEESAGENTETEEIRQMLEETGALIDPHTAVAAALMRRYQDRTGDRTPVVVVSTASPFKFGRAVADALGLDGVDDFACCRALSERTGLPVPAQIAALETLPVRHTLRCAPEEMKNMLLKAFQGAR